MPTLLPPTVLLVEDHPFERLVLTSILRDLGVTDVIEAGNGCEALETVARSSDSIDLVICDLRMPQMDGVEFLRRIGTAGLRPAVVLSSAVDRPIVASVESMATAYGLRVLGSLTKPPRCAALRAFLDRARDDRPAADAAGMSVSAEDLREAIEQRRLEAYFQPKVLCKDGRVVGFEALARWPRPNGRMIPPAAFIPVAERTGLIDPLTDLMLDLAAGHLRRCHDQGLRVHVAVNMSAGSLVDVAFPERLAGVLARHGVNPSDVVLEVTEQRMMGDLANTLDCLSRLRLREFGLAIDDFGTGFASLQQLRQLPVTELKIDRDFVHGATVDHVRRSILESSASLGRKLGLSLVAEGVENQEDWDVAASNACDIIQGYFVSEPMPAEGCLDWARRWTALCA